jgi:anti-sigma regulatory factor (Ser/Thr protein kinase)
VEVSDEPCAISITFIDHGKPYNPLDNHKTPDTTLKAKERKIGGLGVYMTKKIMDEVTYEYKDQCNRLTIRKMITKEIN